jgi:outer membrane biosynthesis protein TonB
VDATLERNNRLKALTGTIVFHGLILLLFIFVVFKNPDPPLFSDTAGVEVNFGLSDEGMGEIQPEPSASESSKMTAPAQQQQAEKSETSKEEKLLTQEDEDAPSLSAAEKPKKEKKPEKKVTPAPVVVKEKSKTEKKEVKEEKKEPVVNANALYKGKSKQGNEGETGKPGDQGIKEGSLYSKTHGNTMGSGTHGTGDGTDGPGGKGGKGYSYSLTGRKIVQPPKIIDNSQETGKVVVDITVDKYGNVTNAVPGGVGSTTLSANLYKKAKEALLKTKFNPSPDGVEEQRGTFTFVFIVE